MNHDEQINGINNKLKNYPILQSQVHGFPDTFNEVKNVCPYCFGRMLVDGFPSDFKELFRMSRLIFLTVPMCRKMSSDIVSKLVLKIVKFKFGYLRP